MLARLFSISFVIVAVVGCAHGTVNSEQLAATEGAARAAEEVGAAKHPQAELYLKLAREQLAEAKALIAADKDLDRVDMLLARAQADAELAVELAKSIEAKGEADRLTKEVADLRVGR